ncbi:unnamed protein product [Durusdinium trenchii]|uniref:EF-hand domain-containing protein n=1 Tax=Durusdinium trenchii TaxID=1381693 RepID=A0ABP0LM48_9DINO
MSAVMESDLKDKKDMKEDLKEKKTAASTKQMMATVEEAFKKWDITGDGAISKYELHAALTQLGMTEAQVDACFRSADLSRDGILQYEEFLEWVFRDPGVVQQYCLKSAKEGLHVVTVDSCQEFWKRFPECENHIEKVFFAAMVILGEDRDLSWTGVKQILKKPHEFLQKLRQFDPGTLTEAKMRKLKYFTSKDFFTQEYFKSHHPIVQALCNWALAIAALDLKSADKR